MSKRSDSVVTTGSRMMLLGSSSGVFIMVKKGILLIGSGVSKDEEDNDKERGGAKIDRKQKVLC